jgi:predicted RNA methylase
MKKKLKKYIPIYIILLRRKYLLNKKVRETRKLNIKVIEYFDNIFDGTLHQEQRDILNYLGINLNSISPFPYTFPQKYNPNDIIVYEDKNQNMQYVMHENKRLYFKKDWDKYLIQVYYNALLIEQDIESPHRYETAKFKVEKEDVVIDAGSAEGNFALSIVEKAKKVYLFEVDETWIEALKATFAPWKDKVVIVPKYISDNDCNDHITLDTFFRNGEKLDFIKADIEGAETQLLVGAKNILSKQTSLKIVLCTYHKQQDAEDLNKALMNNGFHTEFSKGYMLFYSDPNIAPPFIRKGLIRGIKQKAN